jgi:broad specificity phosphatase PhoE
VPVRLAALHSWADGTPTLVVAHGSLIRDVVGLLDGVDHLELGRMKAAGHAEPLARRVERWPIVPR